MQGRKLTSSHVCRAFLEAGYQVRAAVAFASQGEYLNTLFVDHGDKFQYIVVSDMAVVSLGTAVEDLIDG